MRSAGRDVRTDSRTITGPISITATNHLCATNHLWSIEQRDQREVLPALVSMCWPGPNTILDPTYGNGGFYDNGGSYDKGGFYPSVAGDNRIDRARDLLLDFTCLPFGSNSFDVVLFDPPFQPATTNGIIGNRFTKPVSSVFLLEALVRRGAAEAYRIARRGIVIKIQDYIHNHKPVWMSKWLWDQLGEPYEVVHVVRKGKLKATNWSKQLSAYRNYSTFMAFSKENNR